MKPRTWHNNLQCIILYRSDALMFASKHSGQSTMASQFYRPEAVWSGKQLPHPAARHQKSLGSESQGFQWGFLTSQPSDVHFTESIRRVITDLLLDLPSANFKAIKALFSLYFHDAPSHILLVRCTHYILSSSIEKTVQMHPWFGIRAALLFLFW